MGHSIKRCLKGNHDLIEITRTFSEMGISDEVVNWCKCCGSVVVDYDMDGEKHFGSMRTPNHIKARMKLDKKDK